MTDGLLAGVTLGLMQEGPTEVRAIIPYHVYRVASDDEKNRLRDWWLLQEHIRSAAKPMPLEALIAELPRLRKLHALPNRLRCTHCGHEVALADLFIAEMGLYVAPLCLGCLHLGWDRFAAV